MTIDEMLHFVTWHFEVGSALDTRVKFLGHGPLRWKGLIEGPRFSVEASMDVIVSGNTILANASMNALSGSHIFDMVLGCRLMCPPGHVERPPHPSVFHKGTGHYYAISHNCAAHWGMHGSRFECRSSVANIPVGLEWCPYISDEHDGWRLHARARTASGKGYRRTWIMNRELPYLRVGPEGAQHVDTEELAQSPFYRIFRSAVYRERTLMEAASFSSCIEVDLPEGLLP